MKKYTIITLCVALLCTLWSACIQQRAPTQQEVHSLLQREFSQCTSLHLNEVAPLVLTPTESRRHMVATTMVTLQASVLEENALLWQRREEIGGYTLETGLRENFQRRCLLTSDMTQTAIYRWLRSDAASTALGTGGTITLHLEMPLVYKDKAWVQDV